nr:reverse transcriptase domain-containing protein [Tanacetum cinerariifolium]
MQTNMTSLNNSNLELKKMFGQFMKMNTTLSLGSGTLPAKPKTYMLREPTNVVIPTNLKGNNQGRNQFFQGDSHGQNLPPVYQAPAYQAPTYQSLGYQALVHQPSTPQLQDNDLGPPGFNQNQNRNNQNQNFQNQNRSHGIPQGNNQGRNQFFQGASHGQNLPPVYQAPAYQAPTYQSPGYQALVHQPSTPQLQGVTTNEFTNFMKANDAILKNMQTNMTSLNNSNLELKKMFGQFMKMNTTLSLGSGTLPGNIITNPKEELKGITTRSGNAYQGPTIPTTSSSLPQVVERETELLLTVKLVVLLILTLSVQQPLAKPKTYMLREPTNVVIPTNLKGNNQGRNQFFQGDSHGQNLPPVYQAPAYQAPTYQSLGYQALVHQPSTPQLQAKTDKSSIDESSKVELKDLPPHLEYAFLGGDNKFPVIIAKDLSDEEKTALITVLKSHK